MNVRIFWHSFLNSFFYQVEVAIKKILSGEKVGTSGALRNPECLDLYKNITELML